MEGTSGYYTECHGKNTVYIVIESDIVNHNIQTNLYSVYIHLTNQF